MIHDGCEHTCYPDFGFLNVFARYKRSGLLEEMADLGSGVEEI